MKCHLLFIALLFCSFAATSQTSITAVTTSTVPTVTSTTYTNVAADTTYNWGVAPNNLITNLTGFTSGSVSYTYANAVTGTVYLRRVDNANAIGNVTLAWVEATTTTSPTVFNMSADYEKDQAVFLNNHVYNKGADNLFGNVGGNSNNIERLDWIIPAGYATTQPDKVGFAVFDRGPSGSHDVFAIAAITSLSLGLPNSYSNIVRVTSAEYGDIGPNVTYRVLHGIVPGDLFNLSGTSQNRGGVFISYQDLGITANTPVYGYSLFAGDLPVGATSTDIVDWTNITNFPTTTSSTLNTEGGIDLIAITGISIANSVLPTHFMNFDAVENNDIINLKWVVENENSVDRYEIERSTDGINYFKINEVKSVGDYNGAHTYSLPDNVASVSSNQLFYRISQYDKNGSYYYSNTVAIRRNSKTASILLYPNPVSEFLFVNIPSSITDKGVLAVINSAGARVISKGVQLFNGNNSFTVNGVRQLPNGIYQLSIKLESGKTIVKQFSKQ
jgi:hypothetical protein